MGARVFISDVYLAHMLHELDLRSLPRPDHGTLRSYLPYAQKHRIVVDKTFDLVSRYCPFRIFADEIADNPHKLMLFRGSIIRDINRLQPHTASTLLYSFWPGYLDRDDGRLASWCYQDTIALEITHTSGHADQKSLVRLAQALNPRTVVPIHTEAPQVVESLIQNVHVLPDGDWLETYAGCK